MKPDPRTALVVAALSGAAGLASTRGAIVALGALGIEGLLAGVRPRVLAVRLAPLACAFALFLLLLPLAPRAVLGVAVQGLAVSSAAVVLGAVASPSGVIGALQGWRLPRVVVAFLVILARHAEGVVDAARQAHRALVTRGGYDRAANLGRSTAALLARVLDEAIHRADHVARALELRGFQGRVPGLARWRLRCAEIPLYALAVLLSAVVLLEAGPWSR